MRSATRSLASCALWVLSSPVIAVAQGTAADYARAEALPSRFEGLLVNAPDAAVWIPGTHRFWYRKSVKGGFEFVLVDADARSRAPAFDHARLAASLSSASGGRYTGVTLPFNAIAFAENGQQLEFTADSTRWRCDITSYGCTKTGAATGGRFGGGGVGGGRGGAGGPAADERPRLSPDRGSEAFVRNFNVYVRRVGSRDAVSLSTDGSEGNAYALRSITWSPDSRKIAAYRVKPGYRRLVRYVESSPEDQVQPKYMERFYLKPGDVLDVEQPVLFDLDSNKQTVIDNALFPNAYDMTDPVWRRDSRHFTFEYNQRGHQVFRIIEVDAATGASRAVISEEPKTFFDYRTITPNPADHGTKFRFDIDDGREIIWMSERDGWAHLYLHDGLSGAVKNQITKGDWVVRAVDSVDVAHRQIWFRASGMYAGKDPYFVHYYRINFDGTGLTTYTQADGMHTLSWSPDHQLYVDTWSTVDQPAAAELHRTADQQLVMPLERGDASALLAAGWRAPEVFHAPGRDGKTEIWGVIVRPTNFDPRKKYPVIENIYAGPQGSFVPKTFGLNLAMQKQAELGFIVSQIDGMGTANRSKAFHEVAWKNLGDAGLPDRILWHKAVAARYPWYDISRVGIYGGSAGGQNSLGALLFHPEFYKVAVSYAGCHDNRMDKIWWNELWMSWPIGPQYSASSNVDNARRLQGKVLLVVGELDTNVDPSSTMQVVNALIKANKTFDLLVVPGAEHNAGRGGDSGPYGERKRWDYFVHNLLGVEPPERNAVRATDGGSR